MYCGAFKFVAKKQPGTNDSKLFHHLSKILIGALESSIETPSCTVYAYENQVIRLVMRKVEVVVLRSFDGGGPGGNSVGPGGAAVVGDYVTRRFKNGGRVGNVWAADAG